METMATPDPGATRLSRGSKWTEGDEGRSLRFAVNGTAGAVVLEVPLELAGPAAEDRYQMVYGAGPLTVHAYVPVIGGVAMPTNLLFGGRGFVATLDAGRLGESQRLIEVLHAHGVEKLYDELEARWRSELVPVETPEQILTREREVGAQLAEARLEGPPPPPDEAHTMQPIARQLYSLSCRCGWTSGEHDTQQAALAEAELHVRAHAAG